MNQKQNLPTTLIQKQVSERYNADNQQYNLQIASIIAGACAICTLVMIPEAAYAFDTSSIKTNLVKPIVDLVVDNYGSFVVAAGAVGAVASPGDLAVKAKGFGIGAVLCGLVMSAAKTGYGIVVA